ncbi:DNA modification methylase [Microbacterium sp.]|uniref:DNA modification methylase n=1 Tax=Microbacterium sp. TaxID=51671 RepID=UPI0039E6777E
MKSRRLAAVALAAAVVLTTAGCNMMAPQATTITYSPAEGATVFSSEPLKVRNALLVADESGTSANFLAAVVNDTDDDLTLLVGLDGDTQRVKVPARSAVSLGYDGAEPLLFTGLDAKPGTDVELTFQSGTGEAVAYRIPVLDGTLDYLADFVPAD